MCGYIYIYKYEATFINVGDIKAGHLDHHFCFIHYFIGLDFLGYNFNINVVIIICIFPPKANFLGELWSCDIGTLS